MITLRDVIEGLRKGNSYRRSVDMRGGYESLTPAENGKVKHLLVMRIHKPLTDSEKPRRAVSSTVEVCTVRTEAELFIDEVKSTPAFAGNTWRQVWPCYHPDHVTPPGNSLGARSYSGSDIVR